MRRLERREGRVQRGVAKGDGHFGIQENASRDTRGPPSYNKRKKVDDADTIMWRDPD